MSEYILRETGSPGIVTQEIVGELVRCKDCRYGYHWIEIRRNGIPYSWIECRNPNGLNRDVPEDGFCYCGERKDDGNI